MSYSISLLLTGGGSRGAYQAGALWRMNEALGVAGANWRINSVSGISAGSINAAYYASVYSDPRYIARLGELWTGLRSKHVFRTDLLSLSKLGSSFVWDTLVGPLQGKKTATSLVDTSPLRKLLIRHIDFNRIKRNLSPEGLHSIGVTAYDYDYNGSVCFVETCLQNLMWEKRWRRSELTEFDADHILASCAIPLVFPAVYHKGRYFADGVIRNMAPLGPLLQFGADKILIFGVDNKKDASLSRTTGKRPSVGSTLGLILNSLFFDYFEMDIERLESINTCIDQGEASHFRKVPYYWIRPSIDIVEIARETYKSLPRQIRYLLAGLGDSREVLELASYLLFEGEFTSRLVRLGYNDFKANEARVLDFLNS